MSSETTRLYLKFFIGTIAIWVVIVLATAILLARTPEAPTELIFVICAGAIVSLLWGTAWYLVLTHERPTAASVDQTAATEAHPTDGTQAQGTTGALRQAPFWFMVGTQVIWIALLVATAFTIRDTPQLIAEMLLILGGGAIWSLMVAPSILAASSASRMTPSGPTA
jgi:hypothetical protein